jgi:radical SAM superfamily enzyme YgiQ (UPF0313 family)
MLIKTTMNKDLLVVTAPFTYTFGPSLSPAVLKASVESTGKYTCGTWDLSAEFNFHNETHEYYETVIAWMQNPEIKLTVEQFKWYTQHIKSYAKKIVYEHKPKNLGISILTVNSHRFAEDLCFHVKSLDQNLKIIIGGGALDIFQYQYSMTWGNLMLSSYMADVVVLGEGELEILNILEKNITGIVNVPQLTNVQLNQLPVPDYSDYDFSLYSKNISKTYWSNDSNAKTDNDLVFLITASKGCVKNCNFCDVGKIWERYRVRNGESVANEILTLHEKYGANYFSFTDSLINGGLKPFFEMNTVLTEKLANTIKYEGQMICRSQRDMPEKYFQIMKSGGCYRVQIGLESGSQRVRLDMGKGSTDDDVAYTTSMLIKYGIYMSWNIIAGYPTETDEDWEQTMKLVKYWLPRSNGLLEIFASNTFMLIGGTPMVNDPVLINKFDMHSNVINGYSAFAWTSGLNPENTFDVRARRFEELCDYYSNFEKDPLKLNNMQHRLNLVKQHLQWYHETKRKKIYSIVTN